MFHGKQMSLFKVLHYGVNKIYVLKGFLNSRIFWFQNIYFLKSMVKQVGPILPREAIECLQIL